jgi:hypothetical protein
MQFGNCRYCKFRIPFQVKYGKGFKHWGEKLGYQYICQRFPPSNVTSRNPYDNETLVKSSDGCWEFQSVDV